MHGSAVWNQSPISGAPAVAGSILGEWKALLSRAVPTSAYSKLVYMGINAWCTYVKGCPLVHAPAHLEPALVGLVGVAIPVVASPFCCNSGTPPACRSLKVWEQLPSVLGVPEVVALGTIVQAPSGKASPYSRSRYLLKSGVGKEPLPFLGDGGRVQGVDVAIDLGVNALGGCV